MSSPINPALRDRSHPLDMHPFQFQRGAGKMRLKKAQKKLTLKFKHLLLMVFALAGIFYLAMRGYLYLISTPALNIKTMQVTSQQSRVAEEVRLMIDGKTLGNILLLDMAALKKKLEANRWVKEARIRKSFPSTLKIEIRERIPAALLQKGGRLFLIDEDGRLLEEVTNRDEYTLPVLIDANGFLARYEDKIRLAWDCFHTLPEAIRAEINVADLTEDGCLSLQFKNRMTRLILGRDRFLEKIKTWQGFEALMDSEYGTPEYVDMRFFEDRIYFKPLPPPVPEQPGLPKSPKEVY